MGLFDFVTQAGEKLFGTGKLPPHRPQEGVRTLEKAKADKETSRAITELVADMGMQVEGFEARFIDGTVTVKGRTGSQAEKEKIVLLIGNTQGVARVDDRMTVEKAEPEATIYTVQAGDTLSKIARAHYGDASKYTVIFEANRPMLKDPDKIYPGQALRIPPRQG